VAPNETNVTLVSLAEVKNILKKLSKERKELLYEQRIALEHAQKFSKLPLKKMQELIKDLKKLEIIDDLYAYKIADLLPTSADDVKAIFAKSRITLDENNIKKILEIVNKYFVE
jgi:DNA-directed RNA polymerase subunit F